MPVTEAQALMRREKFHHLPVVDKDRRLVGIVSEKDLLYAAPSPATSLSVYEISYLLSKLTVDKVMTRDVVTVTEDASLEDAARFMADRGVGGLPVVRGALVVGIITESDLFRVFIELFAAREKGVRVTMLIPEKKGELAEIASAIAREGGNILAFGSSRGDDPTSVLCTIKVDGIPRDRLVDLLKPLVLQISDVREV
jgi:acetoin utilization protein AcuB